MKRFISDLHFFHEALNWQMDERGFESLEAMHDYMILQWNAHVKKKDEVYILGDFSLGSGEETNEILRQLSGKLYLIKGNHDRYLKDKAFDLGRFEWVKPYAEIRDGGKKLILSHYPILCYNGQYHLNRDGKARNYMLYGHVHNSFDEMLMNRFLVETRNTERPVYCAETNQNENRKIPCQMINCFCMFSDYVPLSLEEWIKADEERRNSFGGTIAHD